MELKIKKVDPEIPLPKYQHGKEDAGMDLRAAEKAFLDSREYKLIKTGIKVAIPHGYAGFIYPRSGLALKKGVTVLNADGVIDPGYRGEIGVILINHGQEGFEVQKYDRIAQFILHPVSRVEWQEVQDLTESERGTGGFGHSGRK